MKKVVIHSFVYNILKICGTKIEAFSFKYSLTYFVETLY